MSKKRSRLTPAEKEQMEYKEYESQLDDETKQWARQFYEEYYASLGDYIEDDERILNTEEMIKEAKRNHNNLHRDAFSVAAKAGKINDDDTTEFMEAASKEWEWRDAYTIGGSELAHQTIMYQAREELLNEPDHHKEWLIILARMYIKLNELRLLNNRQKAKWRKPRGDK